MQETGVELELVESLPLLEWLANNYKSFGAVLEIVTDRSQEGAQFVRGFGGIGGPLLLSSPLTCLSSPDPDPDCRSPPLPGGLPAPGSRGRHRGLRLGRVLSPSAAPKDPPTRPPSFY